MMEESVGDHGDAAYFALGIAFGMTFGVIYKICSNIVSCKKTDVDIGVRHQLCNISTSYSMIEMKTSHKSLYAASSHYKTILLGEDKSIQEDDDEKLISEVSFNEPIQDTQFKKNKRQYALQVEHSQVSFKETEKPIIVAEESLHETNRVIPNTEVIRIDKPIIVGDKTNTVMPKTESFRETNMVEESQILNNLKGTQKTVSTQSILDATIYAETSKNGSKKYIQTISEQSIQEAVEKQVKDSNEKITISTQSVKHIRTDKPIIVDDEINTLMTKTGVISGSQSFRETNMVAESKILNDLKYTQKTISSQSILDTATYAEKSKNGSKKYIQTITEQSIHEAVEKQAKDSNEKITISTQSVKHAETINDAKITTVATESSKVKLVQNYRGAARAQPEPNLKISPPVSETSCGDKFRVILPESFVNERMLDLLRDHRADASVFMLGAAFGITLGLGLNAFRNRKSSTDEHRDSQQPLAWKGLGKYRLILGVRTDLKMTKGKVAAQCAHAAVMAYKNAENKMPDALKKWTSAGQAKITVKVEDEEEMLELHRLAKQAGILTSIVHDAGHTQIAPNTRTVIAIGPAPKEIVDKITSYLRLY